MSQKNTKRIIVKYFKIHLFRKPTELETKQWTNNLEKSKNTKNDLSIWLKEKDEYKSIHQSQNSIVLHNLYWKWFQRRPDRSGYKHYLTLMENGERNKKTIEKEFRYSKEYQNLKHKKNTQYVNWIFGKLLYRKPSEKELNKLVSKLDEGQKSKKNLKRDLQNCNEYEKDRQIRFIKKAYWYILERQYDNEGLEFWTKQLKSGEKTKKDIFNDFFKTAEYKNKHK
ncbi:hypothetical protein M0813_00998 [Anaeramoeba flamelloides]|uniref:DUF4214 domain-containing protein n=1 Tax=Anaeramoeba flamelloides TaxID=1746091 RepID=A0ABQ8X0D8_9EUKA|nr:hypothetical protein M0813_00998 [Anaeramoeba flamelloides]